MARKTHNELLAGLFTLAAVGATLGVVLWLGASGMFHRVNQRAVFFADARDGSLGLEVGNPVQINDRAIGKITDIRTSPQTGKTFYYADIDAPGVVIRSKDAQAQAVLNLVGTGKLVVTNLGADSAPPADETHPVQITGGLEQALTNIYKASTALCDVVQVIQGQMDPNSCSGLLFKVHDIMSELRKAAGNVTGTSSNVLAETDASRPGSLMAKVRASADDVNKVTASLAAQLDPNSPQALLAKINRSADDIAAMTSDARPKVEQTLTAVRDTTVQLEKISRNDVVQILADVKRVSADVMAAAANLNKFSESAKQTMVMNRDQVDEIVFNMAQVSANLKATSKEVRRNPWRLLYQPDKPELRSQNLYDAARAFATGAEQLDSSLARLNNLAKANPKGIESNDPELAKIKKQIEETFGNFNKVEQALWKELSK